MRDAVIIISCRSNKQRKGRRQNTNTNLRHFLRFTFRTNEWNEWMNAGTNRLPSSVLSICLWLFPISFAIPTFFFVFFRRCDVRRFHREYRALCWKVISTDAHTHTHSHVARSDSMRAHCALYPLSKQFETRERNGTQIRFYIFHRNEKERKTAKMWTAVLECYECVVFATRWLCKSAAQNMFSFLAMCERHMWEAVATCISSRMRVQSICCVCAHRATETFSSRSA